MVVLLALLFGGAYYGWRALTSELPSSTVGGPTEPSPACTTQTVSRERVVLAKSIRVSVFNAGTTIGLADQTMVALRGRGFQEGVIDNAPSYADVARVQIWDRRPGSPQARLVAAQFPGGVPRVATHRNIGPGIDVVVGDDFPGVSPQAPTQLRFEEPKTVCRTPKN